MSDEAPGRDEAEYHRARARSFERGAEQYEAHRRGYPAALFDALVERAGELPRRGVLEVGPGTGKATVELARRGWPLVAMEPSADMARVLTRRLAEEGLTGRVTVRAGTFEDVNPAAEAFGVVVAAQSFHWTDPATRWARLRDLLGGDGIAFLFWNSEHLDVERHDAAAVRDAIARHAPGVRPDLPGRERRTIGGGEGPLAARDPDRTYPWRREIGVGEYLAYLATTSQYAVLPAPVRTAVFDALRAVLGERVHLSGRTALWAITPGELTDC